MPIKAKLDAFQFSLHHAQNPSASVYEILVLGVGTEKLPDAEELHAQQDQARKLSGLAGLRGTQALRFVGYYSYCQAPGN
jgi:hypothetical protein